MHIYAVDILFESTKLHVQDSHHFQGLQSKFNHHKQTGRNHEISGIIRPSMALLFRVTNIVVPVEDDLPRNSNSLQRYRMN